MNGRYIALGLALVAAIGGGGMYYLQVYAFYAPVAAPDAIPLWGANGPAASLAPLSFTGIDATSSPIRYRACFTLAPLPANLPGLLVPYPGATPLVAPGWFDCFDAGTLTADLETGAAVAVYGQPMGNGTDRIVALYPDGRGYAWNQLNACYLAEIQGEGLPDGCLPARDAALPTAPPPAVDLTTFFQTQ